MTDTNGNVAPSHLGAYQGVLVSLAILPDLRAAGDEVRAHGYTFGIYLPDGGYRSLETQQDMHDHPAAHNLLPSPPAPPLAPVGYSRHGYGRAVDMFSNAPFAVLSAIAVKHHFTHWLSNDKPHWEWGNALTPADVSSIPLDNTAPREEDTAMYVKGSAAQIYVVYTDANGAERLRLANLVEGQLATASGRVIVCSDTQLTQLGAECGWVGGAVTPPPLPHVQVDGGTGGGLTTEQAAQLAAIPNATQLGQALTSTVSLVNGHTDQLKVARTLPAIP